MTSTVSNICRNITSFFDEKATELGRSVKFVQRHSKLTAKLFAETLIASSYMGEPMSLESLCGLLKKKGVKLTKQSLHERFTPEATSLMEGLLNESFKRFRMERIGGIELFNLFTGIKLLDSTGFSLPASMKDRFEGFGGDASEAGLKVQALLDYVEGQLEQLTITGGRKNDQSYQGHLDTIQIGALYLQDLGYFSLAYFKKLTEAGAYFISRYLLQTKVYDKAGKPIHLVSALGQSNGLT